MPKKKQTKSVKKTPQARTTPEVRGIICLFLAIALFLSLLSFILGEERHNLLGMIGYSMGYFFHAGFGLAAFFLPIFLGWVGWRLLFNNSLNHLPLKILYVVMFLFSSSMLLTVLEIKNPHIAKALNHWVDPSFTYPQTNYHLGGAPFYYFYRDVPFFSLEKALNWVGVTALFATSWFASLLFLTKLSPLKFYLWAKERMPVPAEGVELSPPQPLSKKISKEVEKSKEDSECLKYVKMRMPKELEDKTMTYEKEEFEEKQKPLPLPKKEAKAAVEVIKSSSLGDYKLPPLTLLTNAKKIDQTHLKQNLKKQADILEETLQSFGIEAKVGQINCGPTITSFEVHPSIGVKVQRIKTLEDDIALNMEAKSIRIIAPIPGKAAVGIEVPNPQPQEVGFKEMLAAYQQGSQKFRIPILLGKTVNGDYVMSDLTKFPHCIIAGATGSGKSVCINTIVMSILATASPDEVKLLMVDPKKVELTPYTRLPHMLAPVITEPRDACVALNWLVREMEKRYEILKLTGTRNIESFNHRKIDEALEKSLDIEIPKKLPYFVGIIDELADLMMVSSSDIETPIARIAQMARAVGIHLILATQRPSREVITGLIKANFPTRISFKVASRVNSQIVLDETGAESLLGNGDMLFLPPGTSHLVRAQGAYIRDEDITAVIKFITDAAPPQYVIESFKDLNFASDVPSLEDEPKDALYEQALDVIMSTGNASTTFLQRKLKVGYARAASLIDQLEQRGVVGPAEGAKPRKILRGGGSKQHEDNEL